MLKDFRESINSAISFPSSVGEVRPNNSTGLYILIGSASSGKSRTLTKWAETAGGTVVIADEPDFRSRGSSVVFLTNLVKDVIQVKSQAGGQKIALDSIKSLIYLGKTLTTGGISLDVMSDLSSLSSIFERNGITVVASLNPLQKTDVLFEALAGAVKAVIDLDKSNIACRLWNGAFYSRYIGSVDGYTDGDSTVRELINAIDTEPGKVNCHPSDELRVIVTHANDSAADGAEISAADILSAFSVFAGNEIDKY